MKEKDLRIGNTIHRISKDTYNFNGEGTDKIITDADVNVDLWILKEISELTQKEYFAIELTEKVLLKIGFEKINHIHGYSFYSLSKSKLNKCNINIYDNKTLFMNYSVKHCKYLHELQNLFFVLTGSELVF
jgi:hypothetical protein